MNSKQLWVYISKVFVSYFLAIGIPVCALTTYYLATTIPQQRQLQYAQYQENISEDIRKMSSFMERVYDFVNVLSRSSHIREVQNDSYERTVFSYGQIQDTMNVFCENSSVDAQCSLYVQRSNRVLSTEFGVKSNSDYRDWALIEQFLSEETSMVQYRIGNQIVILTVLPKYYHDSSIVFLFYIDIGSFYQQADPSEYMLYSMQNKLLLGEQAPMALQEELALRLQEKSNNSQGHFSNSNTAVWYEKEPYSKMTFLRMHNLGALQQTVNRTIGVSLLVLLGSLCCVCLIAYIIARYYTRPVEKLTKQIALLEGLDAEGERGETIFESIYCLLHNLKQQNSNYARSVQQNMKIVKDHAIRDLLWGRVPSNQTAQDFLKGVGFEPVSNCFLPILVQAGTNLSKSKFNKLAEVNILVKDILEEYFTEKKMLLGSTILELDQIALVLNCCDEVQINFEESLCELAQTLQQKLGVQVKSVAGYSVDSSEEMCREFINMRKQLRQAANDKRAIILIQESTDTTEFPSYLKSSLLSAIRTGDQQLVSQMLEQMFNVQHRAENKQEAGNYIFAVLGNIVTHLMDDAAALSQNDLDILGVFAATISAEEREAEVKMKILRITEKFESSNIENEDSAYVHNAKVYIKNNLNRDLSLDDVAQYIGINISYFSRIFKAETGVTPLQYITNLRIEKAKELLQQENLTIKAISDQLGYNDTRSFIRFFKKLENCTPSEYRTNSHE